MEELKKIIQKLEEFEKAHDKLIEENQALKGLLGIHGSDAGSDIDNLLISLHLGNLKKEENFRIWPRNTGADVYSTDENCREHWCTAMKDIDNAVRELSKAAKLLYESKNK